MTHVLLDSEPPRPPQPPPRRPPPPVRPTRRVPRRRGVVSVQGDVLPPVDEVTVAPVGPTTDTEVAEVNTRTEKTP